jgi:N,N-dimethylformamidase beta subunit-like, C-terminal
MIRRCAPLLVATAIAGCGGGGASSTGLQEGHQPFRWLVATGGSPPSVAQENRAPGTTAWRLPGPRELLGGERHGAIEGYVSSDAVLSGQNEKVYVSAPRARTVTVSVYRMGWYGGTGGRLVLESDPLPALRQPPCMHRSSTGLTECDWQSTLAFTIPPALPSGVYIAKLKGDDGSEADCIFVVRSHAPAPLLVELPTATWQAYNEWGGDSLYPGGKYVEVSGSSQGVEVSYDRPYQSQTGAGQFFIREVAIVRFLERYGYPASYTTIPSLDAEPHQVAGARGLIDAGHSEYWSTRDEEAFARARDARASLMFFSSDTMAWRVRFESDASGRPAHRIVAYKQSAQRDPDAAEPTGLFPLGGADVKGSAYNGCITPRVSQSGPPVYRLYPWTARAGPSWLFAGAGGTGVSILGIVGYELDQRTPASPPGTEVVGQGTAPCGAETEPSPVHGTLAQSTLYTARSGAFVFASGTMGWLYGLEAVPQASPDAPAAPDPRVVAITRNLLGRALGR